MDGPVTCKKINQTNYNPDTDPSTTEDNDALGVLSRISGMNITNSQLLYKAFGSVRYSGYLNDIYDLKTELKRIKNRLPLNCVDQAQTAMRALFQLGWTKNDVRIVRGEVLCRDGKWHGHVWLQLYYNAQWNNYDPSAKSAHGYNIGTLICTRNHKITNINPSWAVSDDGRT